MISPNRISRGFGRFEFGGFELRDHVAVMQDRARNQVREIRHEQRVMRQRVMTNLAPVGVDQKCDLGEGVKGDADREQNVHGHGRRKQRVEIANDEAGIFEDAKRQQIAGDARRQHGKARPLAQISRDQQPADEIIERDRSEQQRHERPVAERIKHQRRQREPDDRGSTTETISREIASESDRQKHENERVGVEKHRFPWEREA